MKKLIILLLLICPLTGLSAEENIYGIYDDHYSEASVLRGWIEIGMPCGVGVGGGIGASFLSPVVFAEINGGFSYNSFMVVSDTPALNAAGETAVESFTGMHSGLFAGGKIGYVLSYSVKEKPFKWVFDYLNLDSNQNNLTYLYYDIDGPVHQRHIIGAGVKYLPTGSGFELLRRDADVFWHPDSSSSLFLYPFYRFSREYNFKYTILELDDDGNVIPSSLVSGEKDYSGSRYIEGGLLSTIDLMQLGGYFEVSEQMDRFKLSVGLGMILKLDAPKLAGYDLAGRISKIFSGSTYYSEALCLPLTLTAGIPLELVLGGEDEEGEGDE